MPDSLAWLQSMRPCELRLTRSTRMSCESLWKAHVISRQDIVASGCSRRMLSWRKKRRYWAPCSSMERRCLMTWATDSTITARLICSGPDKWGIGMLVRSPQRLLARVSSKVDRSLLLVSWKESKKGEYVLARFWATCVPCYPRN